MVTSGLPATWPIQARLSFLIPWSRLHDECLLELRISGRYVPVHSIGEDRSSGSFKSQFSASQDKAHNRNIATKIHEEIAKLRAGVDASPTTPSPWSWE